MTLGAFSLVAPVSGAYVSFGNTFLYLIFSGAWRQARADDERFARLRHAARPIHLGVAVMLVCIVLSALLGASFSPYAEPVKVVAKTATHMLVKLGLLWFVIYGAMVLGLKRGFDPQKTTRWLVLWLAVHFLYCVAQRHFGLDWSHGFDARLGPHRFAYGVYRISGYMGHPLTLAFNLVLIIAAAGALVVRQRDQLDPALRRAWLAILILAVATLLLTGSRFPILMLPLVALWTAPRLLTRHWKWALLAASAVGLFLWIEGSLVGRFAEAFDQTASLQERFPRFVNWQVHARMWLDHPLFGVGQANLDRAYAAYYNGLTMRDNVYTAHNIYLQTLADSGLIGGVGLGALITGLLLSARRLGRSQAISGLLLVLVISGLMQNNLRDSEFIYALWFLLALTLMRSALGPDEREPPKDLKPAAHPAYPAKDLPG